MSLLLVIQERHKTAQSCRHQEALYLRKIELQKCNLLTILCKKGDTECKLSEKKNRIQIHSPFPKDPSKSNENSGRFFYHSFQPDENKMYTCKFLKQTCDRHDLVHDTLTTV